MYWHIPTWRTLGKRSWWTWLLSGVRFWAAAVKSRVLNGVKICAHCTSHWAVTGSDGQCKRHQVAQGWQHVEKQVATTCWHAFCNSFQKAFEMYEVANFWLASRNWGKHVRKWRKTVSFFVCRDLQNSRLHWSHRMGQAIWIAPLSSHSFFIGIVHIPTVRFAVFFWDLWYVPYMKPWGVC